MNVKNLVARAFIDFDLYDPTERRRWLAEMVIRLATIENESEREAALDALVIEMRPYLREDPHKPVTAH